VLGGLLCEAKLATRPSVRARGTHHRLGAVLPVAGAAVACTIRRGKPRGLPTKAEHLGVGYDDELLFWALRHSHLLRDRISIVDLADLLGVWSDATAGSIVADAAQAG